MAENSSYPGWSGEMDAKEHLGTYHSFISATKWSIVFLVILLSAMAFYLV